MNAIYKVIWNDAIRQYQVVNELCRSRRKACSVKAVHIESASRGIFHALKLGTMAGVLGLLTLTSPVLAADYYVPEFTWSLGGGTITSGSFSPTDVELPTAGTNEQVVIDLSKVTFTDATQLIFGQDDPDTLSYAALVGVSDEFFGAWTGKTLPVVFRDQNGDTNEYISDTGFAKFKYQLGADWARQSNEWYLGVGRLLTEIELTSQDNWQYIDAGEESDVDLSAKITGSGNVTFGFNATGVANEGWLTLNSDVESDEFKQVNDYTGVTRVGYTSAGGASDSTHLVFGMTEAFGDTSMLMVSSNSDVRFGGIDGNKAYTQTVGGLSGSGTLNLGSAAHLTLGQSVVQGETTAPTTEAPGRISIQNSFIGTGATVPESGAVFNIELSGDVAGYEIVFTDQSVNVGQDNTTTDFSGLITLSGGSVTAYRLGRGETFGNAEYADVNKVLTGATLQLKGDGLLRVDRTGEVKNLIISSGADGIEFSGIGNVTQDGQGALMVKGDLTFGGADATVSIKDLDYDLGAAASGKDLIEADNGVLNTLVHVDGKVIGGENYGFILDKAGLQVPVSSEIKNEEDKTVAYGTWELEDELRYDRNHNFDLAYTLKQVDIEEGRTLTITGSEKATDKQDFIAKITGSGSIVFDAADDATGNGKRIEVGDSSTADKNDYTGSTTVTGDTTLVLTESDALGRTSDLIAYGDVEIGSGIEQTVKNINSAGTGKITIANGDDGPGVLNVNADASQTINNIISGAGDLNMDLGDSGRELVFGNSGQGTSFTGKLALGNGSFSLDNGFNKDFAGNASIELGSGAVFDFGSGTSNIKDLTVNTDSKLESSALVIGSDTAPHNITGNFNVNSSTTITLSGVTVETDLSLTDYDGDIVNQNFITVGGDLNLGQGAEISLDGIDLGSLVLEYDQMQNGVATTVAETVWTVNGELTQNDKAMQVGTQLQEIRLIGNTVLSGSGLDNELTALVSDSSKTGSHSLQFSASGGNADFIISNHAGNTYTGETTIDTGVTVTLATDSGFGNTSKLIAEGNVVLNESVDQTIKGLDGSGRITLGNQASLTLDQSGSATINNILDGSGTFNVNLGGGTDELSFTNTNATPFLGTLSLTDGLVRLESGSTTQNVLSQTQFVLGDDGKLIVSGTGSDPRHLGGLMLEGGSKIDFSAVTMGDANSGDAQLQISGDFTINGSNDVSVGGIHLDGTGNILSADDPLGGLKQALVTASGGISYGTDGKLDIDLDASTMKSEIKNSGSSTVAAYGVWSAGGANGEVFTIEGNTLYASLRLSEIQLADATDGLKLNASGLSTDTTLSATITDYNKTAGKIVFEGGNITISGSEANTYIGETEVTGGTVTLAKNSGFGTTSKLSIASGGTVNLGGWMQTVGALEIGSEAQNAMNALGGSGTLTIGTGQTGTSHIWGSNSFSGTIQLAANHNLSINSIAGIGGTATVGFGDNSVLTIDGATGGTFSTHLSGAGTVAVANSTFNVSGDNTAFIGTWQFGNSGSVSVAGTSDAINKALGSGATLAFQSGKLTLALNQGESSLTIDEVLSGAGELVVQGTDGQTFELSSSTSNFGGTLSLEGIGMTVGAGTDPYGANNAQAFAGADLNLSKDALLTVASGTSTDVFGTVTVIDSARFDLGALGFQSVRGQGSATTGTTQLLIDKLVANEGASGTIILDSLGTSRDLAGVVNENALFAGGIDVFQTLIATSETIDEALLGRFSLSGAGSEQVTQNIQSNGIDVATGYYDFELALGSGNTDLGVAYDLTRIDISGSKTLTLSEKGSLDAQLTSENGSGSLTIAADGDITLANNSNDPNSFNSYTGVTNVLGKLTAHNNNLGNTSELLIGTGGHYVNAGDNKVGLLDADGTLELMEGRTLEIAQGADESSNIAGTLTGKGNLSFAAGELTVSGSSPSNYRGTVYVGSANSDAVLTISGAGALGSGSIVLGTKNGSQINIYGTESQTFANKISGSGTINVDLSGGAFAFGTEQLGISAESTLVLDDAIFDLTASDVNFNDDVAGKLAIELTDGSKLINDGSADKDVYSLTLNGGTIDLGEINTEFGQIDLSSGNRTLVIGGKTTIDIASQSDDNVTESGDRTITDGHELLTGGVFYLDIFTGVENLTGDIGNLVLDDKKFEGTTEKLLQDADPDTEGLELVANMTRNDGAFEYDGSKVYLEYQFKEIELLRDKLNQGLLVDAEQKPGGTLSAKITGIGNLKLNGTLNLGATGTVNDYTGITYVLGSGTVTVMADSAFGQTKELDIAAGGVVKLNGFDQKVGALSGIGKLEFASDSDFTLDNYLDKDGAQDIVINNELVAAAGATFTIDGTYGTGENEHASVSFGRKNSLAGMTFTLSNAKFDISGTGDFDYLTSASSSDFVLSTGAAMSVDGTSGNLYKYNELSFAGGSLDVTNVTLVKEGTGSSSEAVIETGKLDLTGSGTLSVAAKIDESFNVLADDQANFVSTLIKYGELDGNPDNLDPSSTFSSSAIEQGGENVAYVNWTGDITIDETARTVGMSYRVAAIQLADETGDGLKLSTQNTAGVDAALDALVTDYVSGGVTHAGNITFDGGEIKIGTGTADDKANTYTGTTNVRSDSTVTLAKDGAFGRTELLNISDGQVNFNDKSETLGSIAVGSSGSITGAGSVTLGIAGYDETSSTILGEHSSFTADVTLANGHTLTLNDTIGIGSSGTIKLESGTNLVINDELGGNFTKTVSGADNANIELSGKGIGIYADNSNYLGDWTLTNGTTASVSGSDTVGVDSILGRGGTVALGTDATLALSQDSGSIVVDNVFAGAGTLVVSGTSEQEFGFSTNWTDAETSGFTGTLSLEDGIKMTVGGGSGSGSYNATNLTNADFKLGSGSTLVVAKQDSIVDTFDVLNVSGGTLSFGGTFGLGASTSELGQLQVGSLSGSGDIALSIPSGGQAVAQTIDQNNLINIDAAGDDLFQALVTVESGTASADRWTLNGSDMTSGSGLRQAVNGDDSKTTVAYAKYDCLALGLVPTTRSASATT